MTSPVEKKPGLRDVIAGDTAICLLDEKVSDFYFYGYSIEELVETSNFESVAHLTLTGEMPGKDYRFGPPDSDTLNKVWRTLSTDPQTAHPMGLLRTAMSAYGNNKDGGAAADPEGLDLATERANALTLTPHVGYMTGQVAQHAAGQGYSAPNAGYGYAENILTMMRGGARPDEFEARCMDIALMCYTEHEFNAGAFGVRIAASAHTDLYSASVAGECILRGPRHGCANEEVMKILIEEGGSPEGVKGFMDAFFAKPGARIPGFGHAVYNLPNSIDPRTTILKPWVKELSRRKNDMRWYETLLALEEYMKERMAPRVAAGAPNAPANADLWTAPLYYLLGIPVPMYTPLFAASRIAGWAAHYLETRYVNAEPILRPRAQYVGPEPRQFEASASHGAPVA